MNISRIIVALDGLNMGQDTSIMASLLNHSERDDLAEIAAYKVHDLADVEGVRKAIRDLWCYTPESAWPFVDYKLHDIPQTVGHRAKALFDAGARIITVHASGGVKMMAAAVARAKNRPNPCLVLAVTVLTSLDENDIGRPVQPEVLRLARMAKEAGVDGLVCSPQEVGLLSRDPDLAGLKFVTPGIRPASACLAVDDQKRIGTPRQAILDGADYLVIGRPITEAADPVAMVKAINQEVAEALAEKAAKA